MKYLLFIATALLHYCIADGSYQSLTSFFAVECHCQSDSEIARGRKQKFLWRKERYVSIIIFEVRGSYLTREFNGKHIQHY